MLLQSKFRAVREIISSQGTVYDVDYYGGDTARYPSEASLPAEVISYIERAVGCETEFCADGQVNTYYCDDEVSRHDEFDEAMEEALTEYGCTEERIFDILAADEGGLDYYEVYVEGQYPEDVDIDLVVGCEIERLDSIGEI